MPLSSHLDLEHRLKPRLMGSPLAFSFFLWNVLYKVV